MKKHVFLKCKNMRIYRKGHQKSRFYRVGARTGNSSKNHQKRGPKPSQTTANGTEYHPRPSQKLTFEVFGAMPRKNIKEITKTEAPG